MQHPTMKPWVRLRALSVHRPHKLAFSTTKAHIAEALQPCSDHMVASAERSAVILGIGLERHTSNLLPPVELYTYVGWMKVAGGRPHVPNTTFKPGFRISNMRNLR